MSTEQHWTIGALMEAAQPLGAADRMIAARMTSDPEEKRWAFRTEKSAAKTLGKLSVGQ
ncbi:MAG: hypothetical protein U0941_22465 [Planctomycetaceae bacterium]